MLSYRSLLQYRSRPLAKLRKLTHVACIDKVVAKHSCQGLLYLFPLHFCGHMRLAQAALCLCLPASLRFHCSHALEFHTNLTSGQKPLKLVDPVLFSTQGDLYKAYANTTLRQSQRYTLAPKLLHALELRTNQHHEGFESSSMHYRTYKSPST